MDELRWGSRVPRDVGVLVEEQVRRWTLSSRTGQRSDIYWPIVTVSREFGTKGTELGRRLAERLGFACWDREIVVAIAGRLRLEESTIVQFDERVRNAIEELVDITLFRRTGMGADYREELRWLVAGIQQQGASVIVGRGAHCIVDPQHALRVRVVCPLEQRVEDIRHRLGLDRDAALRLIRTNDKERAEFVRREFGADVIDPRNYDVTINTATFEPERADALVLMAYLVKFGQLPAATRDSIEPRPPRAEPVEMAARM